MAFPRSTNATIELMKEMAVRTRTLDCLTLDFNTSMGSEECRIATARAVVIDPTGIRYKAIDCLVTDKEIIVALRLWNPWEDFVLGVKALLTVGMVRAFGYDLYPAMED